MALKNFWVEIECDGKQNIVTQGTKSEEARMFIDLFQRVNGKSVRIIEIDCLPQRDGETIITKINVRGIHKDGAEVKYNDDGTIEIISKR